MELTTDGKDRREILRNLFEEVLVPFAVRDELIHPRIGALSLRAHAITAERASGVESQLSGGCGSIGLKSNIDSASDVKDAGESSGDSLTHLLKPYSIKSLRSTRVCVGENCNLAVAKEVRD